MSSLPGSGRGGMRVNANSYYRQLKAWCVAHRATARAVAGEYYRVAGPRYTSAPDIVSGIGGYRANGRWCRRRTTKLLYLSEAPETAMAESNEHARRYNLPLWKQMPKVTVAIRIEADAILDLTDPVAKTAVPFGLRSLMDADWRTDNNRGKESLSQALGRAAFAAGFDGLRVPSKPDPNGINLVVFRRGGRGGARIVLLNPQALKALGRT